MRILATRGLTPVHVSSFTFHVTMSTLVDVFAVARFMAGIPAPWWVAGGWAVDLWLGDVSREHEDLELGLFHSDQTRLRTYCVGWQFFTPVDNQWVPVA